MADIEVRIPDIGNFADVPVIEIHVAPGDTVAPEDPLVTLESDKATLDVPAPAAGTVSELLVSVGDQVSEGTPILVLQGSGQAAAPGRERVREDARRTPGAARPDTAHRAAFTSGSRSPFPISATSPASRSSRCTSPRVTRWPPRTR